MIKELLLILLISLALAQSSSIPPDLAAAMTKAGISTTSSSSSPSSVAAAVDKLKTVTTSVPTTSPPSTAPPSLAPPISAASAASTVSAVPGATRADPSDSQNKDVQTSILIWLIEQIIDLKVQLADCCKAKRPEVVRFKPVDLSSTISLHQQSVSLSFTVTVPPSLNIYALLVQVFYFHASKNDNNTGSHGYMSARMKQRGDYTNVAQYTSRKFNWYANTATELEIIPWRTDLPYILDADIYDTYNTEAPGNPYGKNYYYIRLVGYMTF